MTAGDAERWLDDLADVLPRHATALRDLRRFTLDDEGLVALAVGCSIARAAADDLSDLDLLMVVRDRDWPRALDRIEAELRRQGDLAVAHRHEIGQGLSEHIRLFVQRADGLQYDIVAKPQRTMDGILSQPLVVLADPGGAIHLASTPRPAPPPSAGQMRTWALLGWEALSVVPKYLARGSLWEARACIERARERLWQLWAAAEEVAEPEFGLTSILDATPGVELPEDIDLTVAAVDHDEIAEAARRLGDLLDVTWTSLSIADRYEDVAEYGSVVTESLRRTGTSDGSVFTPRG